MSHVTGLLLDVGCGNQQWRRSVPDSARYIPLDCCSIASLYHFGQQPPQINADGCALPVKSDAIGGIISTFVVEHVPEPAKLVSEASRVLRSGGYFILLGPGDVCPTHGEPYNYYNLTRFGYRDLLERTSFEVIEEYYPSRSWSSIAFL